MPYINKTKRLERNAVYHAYNRGLRRAVIFHDKYDYEYFLRLTNEIWMANSRMDIYAFCLMPNHYHFLLRQRKKYAMGKFFNTLGGAYTQYFNWKYKLEGSSWQGTYKARKIESRSQFEITLKYIHDNPLNIVDNIENYKYSSLGFYLGRKHIPFMKTGCPIRGLRGRR